MYGRVLVLLLGSVLAGACESAPDASAVAVVNAWTEAGLEPGGFADFKSDLMGKDALCKQGQVKGVETTICQYPTADAARAAYKTGLTYVGEITGLALVSGNLMLVAADREQKDPAGRTINQIAQTFRQTAAKLAPPPAAKPGDKAGDKEGEAAGDKAESGKK